MLLADQQANGWATGQPPIFANELQFRFDVIDQQCHITVQVEIGHFENQWITKNGHAADTINLKNYPKFSVLLATDIKSLEVELYLTYFTGSQ